MQPQFLQPPTVRIINVLGTPQHEPTHCHQLRLMHTPPTTTTTKIVSTNNHNTQPSASSPHIIATSTEQQQTSRPPIIFLSLLLRTAKERHKTFCKGGTSKTGNLGLLTCSRMANYPCNVKLQVNFLYKIICIYS